MNRNRMFKPSFLLTVALILCFAFSTAASAQSEALYPNGAKTPPPPESDMHHGTVFIRDFEMGLGGIGTYKFEPWHKYLDYGDLTITDRGNGSIGFSGSTFATQIVSTIAIKLTLQMWTGQDWIDLKENEFKANNDVTVYGADSRTSTSGYYYRVKGYHWVIQGTDFESGYSYSKTILLQ
ncbi:hypothetical protein [Paenibacillus sp. J2TS4]|uniref:hypothetical protein n=1 Tax=Paenibacillus sp. J2TS4 TaxID=2807194 RepID=UPI001B28774D|nr:hypothetical protein [Paenibacillus sp. J2TS4]GIP31244.1 hypothetical protein J2TS4_04540 [Paenibacillus sp. J2TS4]